MSPISPRANPSPTVAEVAAEAGVGKATAARTLGNYGSVSPAARARVLAAAEKLRYRPNGLARSVATGVTNTLGVIVADISNPFFAGVMRGIEDACDAAGYTAIVLSSDENLATERQAIGVLMDKKVDGIIVASAAVAPDELAHLTEAVERGIPTVLLDRTVEGLELDAVVIDNRESARDAVRRFTEHGHRRIAFVWGPTTDDEWETREELTVVMRKMLWSGAERLRGYLDAIDEAGIQFDSRLITHGTRTEDPTVERVSAMLAMEDGPTAILATETEALVGSLRAIRQRGLRYPQDVSVIGFDDSSWAGVMYPPLTMVAQPMTELGEQAARRVFALIEGADGVPTVNTIPARLVSRDSVAGVPSGASAR
jgi:LacI family transcriptional regulator